MTKGDHLRVSGGGSVRHGIDTGQRRVIYPQALVTDPTRTIIRYGSMSDFADGLAVTVQPEDETYDRDAAVDRAKLAIGRSMDGHDFDGEAFIRGCLFNTCPETDSTLAAPFTATASNAKTSRVPGSLPAGPGSRKRSLRREWTWALILMLTALLVGAAVTIIGVRTLMNDMQTTSTQLHQNADRLLELRSALDAHQQDGRRLLTGIPTDTSKFLQEQADISAMFTDFAAALPAGEDTAVNLLKTRDAWQESLQSHQLWGNQVQTDNNVGDPTGFADSSAKVRALLADTQHSALEKMDEGLANTANLEQLLIGARSGYFALAVAATLYFGRRLLNDLIKPVRDLRHGALKLQSGNYRHRIQITRNDELGELAEAFNAMAEAVHDSHEALTYRAGHDTLTGLANRAVLTEQLTKDLAGTGEQKSTTLALLFIDVDNFKDINDSLGHEGGDMLLAQLAIRLIGCVRDQDLAARLGGDEFAIIVTDEDGITTKEVAERIHDALRSPFHIRNDKVSVSVSMGVAQGRPGSADAEELLRQADFAMYVAKHGGKARYQLFDAEDYDRMARRAALKAGLRTAAQDGQLRVHYQPVFDLHSNEIVGLEALVRWEHPSLGLLKPSEFISIAEETGDIDAIGSWVLETATRQACKWRTTIGNRSRLWVAVNLSAYQLSSSRSLLDLKGILANSATEADRIVLEITETALATDIDGGIAALCALKETGARIAIDDFGTGFSSLSTLATLPADILKIDRSFLTHPDRPSAAILEGILGLAHKLHLNVIAEGIEEPYQLQTLRALNCQMGQGYLLAQPAPAAEIEALLRAAADGAATNRPPTTPSSS